MAAHATGEAETDSLRVEFDRSVTLVFSGSSISSDGGLQLHRELNDALGLTVTAADRPANPRTGKNGRHHLPALLRQSIFLRLSGYEDVHDADRLFRDPVMRQPADGRAIERGAASASAIGRFKTGMLPQSENLAILAELPVRCIDVIQNRRPQKSITLDLGSSEGPVYDEQEGTARNGYCQSECLHPLFLFNHFGNLEPCSLISGNVHSAERWEDALKPVLARYAAEARPLITQRRFRSETASAVLALFDLREAEGCDYAIRMKGNAKLHERIDWLTRRRPGRPPNDELRTAIAAANASDRNHVVRVLQCLVSVLMSDESESASPQSARQSGPTST